jgi:diguanylate cyclase
MRQPFQATKKSKRLSNLDRLPKAIYPMRILGMLMAGIAIVFVLIELQADIWLWSWLLFSCLIWPHLAFLLTRKSKQPFNTEKFNLMVDSVIAGSWVPLMGFNLLPSVLLILLNITDKVNTAIKGIWWKAMIVSVVSIAVIAVVFHVPWRPTTSYFVMIGCLPLIIIHFTVVSFHAHRLIHRVQTQNRLLNKLSQQDDLTLLFNRRTWQEKTQGLLKNYNPEIDKSLTLMLIDIDQFKSINDDFGHAVGDDVLCNVAQVITDNCPENAIIGRLGGDEFIVVIHEDLVSAKKIAAGINNAVRNIDTIYPKFRCQVSIGLASITKQPKDIRSWFEEADKALYEAKKTGRNTCVGYEIN